MARVKTTYGKRPKATTTFSPSTDFWSSPDRAPANSKPAPAAAMDDITNTLHSLDIREKEKLEKKEARRKEKRDRAALQAIDANAASSPPANREKTAHGPANKSTTTVVPKTPQRLKKLLPPKKADPIEPPTVEQPPPQTERKHRPRGKPANIPTIRPDSDVDTATPDETTHPAAAPDQQQPRSRSRSRAPATPRRNPSSSMPAPAPDPLTIHAKPLLRLCADRQGRRAPTPFAQWAAALEPYFGVAKIAEASYGEVYRLSLRRRRQKDFGLSASDESVLKVIALKPPAPKKRPAKKKGKKTKTKKEREWEERVEGMSSVESVAGEIRVMRRMAHVPGFTNFRDVRVVKGCPPRSFARAWAEWNEGRSEEKRSIFPDPAEEGSYDDEQLWAIIEMQDAGTDLENLSMHDVGGVFGVWDIFWSVALALAKGEEEARFEHRDLHMGNICIRPANANRPIAAPSPSSITNIARNLNFTGLESTIIDYTLSRAQMTAPAASPDPDESEIAYLDLDADPALFEGDAEVEYQYEMYRCMRAAMYLGDPRADVAERWDDACESGRTWVGYHPQTNLVWLHFILHEMMKQIGEEAGEEEKRGGMCGGKARGKAKAKGGTRRKTKTTKTTKAKKKTSSKRKTVIPDSDNDDDNDHDNDDDGDNVEAPSSSSSSSSSAAAVIAKTQQQTRQEEAEEEADRAATAQLIADKRRKLHKTLRKVQKLLDVDGGRGSCWAAKGGQYGGLHSVKDLVALALEEAWLDEDDVIAVPTLDGDGEGEGEGSLLELVRGMAV
ncbi:haspin protein kinase [Diplodia corticola]|uniref:non-specific serine/threonine protein kinase n=1 Tax=Diplodia corticola TaxID=236234 RepID=A0A1J9RXX4_9PEZI|nr:haspin protein kinase [Diplodia corticola]OJD32317.1 haspin protein kinase [Diplodia corticola]